MKRRSFISSSLILGASLPLGLATTTTSCSGDLRRKSAFRISNDNNLMQW